MKNFENDTRNRAECLGESNYVGIADEQKRIAIFSIITFHLSVFT